MQEPAFAVLLYRYFFFGWLFKDARVGDQFERAAALRHNREQARWLPVYLLRWRRWGLLFYVLGNLADMLLEAPLLATLLFALGSLSLPFNVAIAAAWIGLRGMQPRL